MKRLLIGNETSFSFGVDSDEYLMSYVKDDDDDDDANYNDSPMKLHRNYEYYDIDNMARFVVSRRGYQIIAIHENIRSLPSKYD